MSRLNQLLRTPTCKQTGHFCSFEFPTSDVWHKSKSKEGPGKGNIIPHKVLHMTHSDLQKSEEQGFTVACKTNISRNY